LHCRDGRGPAASQVKYWPACGQAGLLTAECAECGTQMFKRVSERSLSGLQELLDLKIQEAEETPKLAA
jgi:PHP family Zn ribbon phosphoesterase